MKDAEIIQNILNSIDPQKMNHAGDMYLNIIQNEFITFSGTMTIPRISVNGLDYATAARIVQDLAEYMPEFLQGHALLQNRKPATDQHALHFVSRLRGRALDFIHILKINFLFGGDSSTVIERGNTDYYPSYTTNRIYYKSRLIPVPAITSNMDELDDFEPVRLTDSQQVTTDTYFHAYAMFEELDSKSIARELCKKIGDDIFPIPLDLYQFISYEYYTACMNVLRPSAREISAAAELFEIIFIYLYSGFKDIGSLMRPESVKEKFSPELVCMDKRIFLTPESIARIKAYFKRFSLFRDNDLMLKGWRRIDMKAWN